MKRRGSKPRKSNGFDPWLEAIRFLTAVHDKGLVRGDFFHHGAEARLQHGGKAALDLNRPGFAGAEFQDEVDLRACSGLARSPRKFGIAMPNLQG